MNVERPTPGVVAVARIFEVVASNAQLVFVAAKSLWKLGIALQQQLHGWLVIELFGAQPQQLTA